MCSRAQPPAKILKLSDEEIGFPTPGPIISMPDTTLPAFVETDEDGIFPVSVDSLSHLQERRDEWELRFQPQVQPPLTDQEYALRTLEEAYELAQAAGVTLPQAEAQLYRTYSRPVGEVPQEAADLFLNLLGVACRFNFSLSDVALSTFDKIDTPEFTTTIANRQSAKRESLSSWESKLADRFRFIDRAPTLQWDPNAPSPADYPDDFSNAPHSITSLRADRQRDSSLWTPRDVLIEALRDLDSGKISAEALIVIYSNMTSSEPGAYKSMPNHYTLLGMLTAVIGTYTNTNCFMTEED